MFVFTTILIQSGILRALVQTLLALAQTLILLAQTLLSTLMSDKFIIVKTDTELYRLSSMNMQNTSNL